MLIEVKREYYFEDTTLGRMFIDGSFFAYTLEDTVREGQKVPSRTAIGEGVYKARVTYSNRFKRSLVLLEGVENFKGVRVHGGNDHTNTEGCILIGQGQDVKKRRVYNCADVVNRLGALVEKAGEAEFKVSRSTP